MMYLNWSCPGIRILRILRLSRFRHSFRIRIKQLTHCGCAVRERWVGTMETWWKGFRNMQSFVPI